MNKFLTALCAASAVAGIAAPASAAVVAQVFASDDFYHGLGLGGSPYTGTLNDTDTGAAAQLTFQLADYGTTFTINLTDTFGMITNVFTSSNDVVNFYGQQSGFASIGTACAANGNTACVQSTGSLVDLTSTVGSLNGGNGIFNQGQNAYLQVITADAVPEPAMLGLFGLGAIGLGLSRRRKA